VVSDAFKDNGGKLLNWTLTLATGPSGAAQAASDTTSSQSLAGNGPAHGASPKQDAATVGAIDAAFLLSTTEPEQDLPSSQSTNPSRFALLVTFDSVPVQGKTAMQQASADGHSVTAHAADQLFKRFEQLDEWQREKDTRLV